MSLKKISFYEKNLLLFNTGEWLYKHVLLKHGCLKILKSIESIEDLYLKYCVDMNSNMRCFSSYVVFEKYLCLFLKKKKYHINLIISKIVKIGDKKEQYCNLKRSKNDINLLIKAKQNSIFFVNKYYIQTMIEFSNKKIISFDEQLEISKKEAVIRNDQKKIEQQKKIIRFNEILIQNRLRKKGFRLKALLKSFENKKK